MPVVSAKLIETRLREPNVRSFTFYQHPRGAAAIMHKNIGSIGPQGTTHGSLHRNQPSRDAVLLNQE